MREEITNYGNHYLQEGSRERKRLGLKGYRMPRLVFGIVVIMLDFIGLYLMDLTEYGMGARFTGLVIFGTGIALTLQLIISLFAGLINLIERILNRRRLNKKWRGL